MPVEKLARRRLKIGIVGTRGVPARYGGFETFAEELSTRLAGKGHLVTVYCRSHLSARKNPEHRGVRLLYKPAVRLKHFETVSHAALSILDSLFREFDVVLVCNAANAFLCWVPQLAGQKVLLNVDGIERQRRKWGFAGRAVYRLGEFLATQLPDAVISDARVIQKYYQDEYGFSTRLIKYGAPAERVSSTQAVKELGLTPERYFLFVSRLEPENNAHLVVQAYLKQQMDFPLVIVGDAPYGKTYIDSLRRLAARGQVLMPGAIYGEAYRELLSHCFCYIQATEVGGTHPALLEAMGAGALILVNSTPENLEVVQDTGLFYPYNDVDVLASLMQQVYQEPEGYQHFRRMAQRRIAEEYDWEIVVGEYEALFEEVVDN